MRHFRPRQEKLRSKVRLSDRIRLPRLSAIERRTIEPMMGRSASTKASGSFSIDSLMEPSTAGRNACISSSLRSRLSFSASGKTLATSCDRRSLLESRSRRSRNCSRSPLRIRRRSSSNASLELPGSPRIAASAAIIRISGTRSSSAERPRSTFPPTLRGQSSRFEFAKFRGRVRPSSGCTCP